MGVLKVKDGSGNWVPIGMGTGGFIGRTLATASSFTTTSSTPVDITVTAGQAPSMSLALDPTRLYQAIFNMPFTMSPATERTIIELFAGATILRQFTIQTVLTSGNQASGGWFFNPPSNATLAYKLMARTTNGAAFNLPFVGVNNPLEFVILAV